MAAPNSYAGYVLQGSNQDGTGSFTYFYRNGDGRELRAFVRSRGQDHSGGKSKLIEFDPADEIVAEFNRAGIVESSLPEVSFEEPIDAIDAEAQDIALSMSDPALPDSDTAAIEANGDKPASPKKK